MQYMTIVGHAWHLTESLCRIGHFYRVYKVCRRHIISEVFIPPPQPQYYADNITIVNNTFLLATVS